jgi:diaminopimelate epimerase
MVLSASKRENIAARVAIWNADGSRAEQCGNGMRCIGLYLAGHRQRGQASFVVEGPVGDVEIHSKGDGMVSVAMGRPEFAPEAVPMRPLHLSADGWYNLKVDDQSIPIGAVSMGNPHVIVLVGDIREAPVETLGALLAAAPEFPQGCNVGFAQVLSPQHIRLRVLERGAGETRACGSGACAAVAWLRRQGLVVSNVQVEQAGGSLIIEADDNAGTLTLTGPAVTVFEGTIE